MVLEPIAKVALPAARPEERLVRRVLHAHPDARADARARAAQHQPSPAAQTTVRQELKETYSTIEEAKADVSGLWALKQLADRGKIDAAIARTMYTTFLASAFRSIRFGINEAHGRGIAIQLNHFLDQGAFVAKPTARLRRRSEDRPGGYVADDARS